MNVLLCFWTPALFVLLFCVLFDRDISRRCLLIILVLVFLRMPNSSVMLFLDVAGKARHTGNVPTLNTEHRTPNTEHQTPNTEHQTQNTKHRASNTEHRIPHTKHCQIPNAKHQTPHTHRTPNTKHRTPDTKHRTPHTKHRTPNTRHQTPNTAHQTPSTQHTCRRGRTHGINGTNHSKIRGPGPGNRRP